MPCICIIELCTIEQFTSCIQIIELFTSFTYIIEQFTFHLCKMNSSHIVCVLLSS